MKLSLISCIRTIHYNFPRIFLTKSSHIVCVLMYAYIEQRNRHKTIRFTEADGDYLDGFSSPPVLSPYHRDYCDQMQSIKYAMNISTYIFHFCLTYRNRDVKGVLRSTTPQCSSAYLYRDQHMSILSLLYHIILFIGSNDVTFFRVQRIRRGICLFCFWVQRVTK